MSQPSVEQESLSDSVAILETPSPAEGHAQLDSSVSTKRVDCLTYHHTPLNDELKEIRLLSLHQGDFKAEIKTSIHTVPLTPDLIPAYEALSYVWGSTENMVGIRVDNESLAITKNLAEALPYLRYKDKPRILWIDAICVNQQDLKERSSQVKRMADIYRWAGRVIVWLGPKTRDSSNGIRLLEELGSKVDVNWEQMTIKPKSDDVARHWADEKQDLSYDEKELCAIYSIVACPWFERLWIWQEIHLARSNAILICGSDTMLWTSCRAALFGLRSKVPYLKWDIKDISVPFYARVIQVTHLAKCKPRYSLFEIMDLTEHCKYRDPRDRIYAILSLLEPSAKAIVGEPDYEMEPSQVYRDLTLRYIKYYKNINILTHAGLPFKPSDIATWVTDWTVTRPPVPFCTDTVCRHSNLRLRYRGAGILTVTGSLLATVQHVDNLKVRDENLVTAIQRVVSHDILEGSYIGGGSLLTAYCHTFCAGYFSDKESPPSAPWPNLQASLEVLSAILQPGKKKSPDRSPGSQSKRFLGSVSDCCIGRSVFRTREGYIGLAPQMVRPGDQVCNLLGCSTPLLLRPIPCLKYLLIGSCYVPGQMDGEAFLGPIPDPYQVFTSWKKERSHCNSGFLNNLTGKAQYNDPRLESSPGVEIGEEVQGVLYLDGSKIRVPTVEMIEKRGIKLQTFDLI